MTSPTTSPHAQAARDEKRRAALALGVDDAFVATLVDRFYTLVRADPQLGPVFAAQIPDWGPHLAQMNRFWRSILFSTGEFVGTPMMKHIAIPGLDKPLFDRWLELFDQTLRELGSDAARDLVFGRARMIGDSLQHGIAVDRERRLGLAPGGAQPER